MKSKIKNNKTYFYLRYLFYKIKPLFLSFISFILKKSYFPFRKNKIKNKFNKAQEKGYLYIAFGENFYKECVNSAKLLQTKTELPIHLFTDQKDISFKEKSLFYSIKYLPNLHLRSKVDYISLSPFDKTIYLDTDIIVVQEIDELFELLDNYEVLATLDTARKRENISNKISSYKKIPYSFGEINGGLLGFNKIARDRILTKWPKIFYKYMKETEGWDQPSLRILLWELKASLYILPPEFNIRSKELLEKLKKKKHLFGKDHMSPRIYHMHLYDDIYKNKITKVIDPEEMISKAAKKAYKISY